MTDLATLKRLAEAAPYPHADPNRGGVAFVDPARKQRCYLVWGLPPDAGDREPMEAFLAACSPEVILALVDELETLREKHALLTRAVNESADDCDEKCDSYACREDCKTHNPAFWLIAQQAELERARAVVEASEAHKVEAISLPNGRTAHTWVGDYQRTRNALAEALAAYRVHHPKDQQ